MDSRVFVGHTFDPEPGCQAYDGTGHIKIFLVPKEMTEQEEKNFLNETKDYEITEINYGENIIVERISSNELSCCSGIWDLIFLRTTTKSFEEENLLEDEEFISFEEAIEKKIFD